MSKMSIEQAVKVLREAGIKVSNPVSRVKLTRAEVNRINLVLSSHGRAVVTYKTKRAYVYSIEAWEQRRKISQRANKKRWDRELGRNRDEGLTGQEPTS